MILDSINKLEHYAVSQNYVGYDPYDGLMSNFVSSGPFKNIKWIKFGFQQLVKRSPVNLRKILRVEKGTNPVTLGLFIQGYSNLVKLNISDTKETNLKMRSLIEELTLMKSVGFSGASWGYNFDWEAKHATIPAFSPTVVATGIITNGLYKAFITTGDVNLSKLIVSSAEFVLKDLNRTYENETFCFSYSPSDTQRVFNASMKGVRILAQAYSINGDENLKIEARKAVDFLLHHQNSDGSWFYSLASKGNWIDNYHTGYILDCLDEYSNLMGDSSVRSALDKGIEYYERNFFLTDGRPKFYTNKIYPADCTAASQSILTLTRFGRLELAEKVAKWTIKNMQTDLGNFEFRHFRYYKIKTPFMRWSDAWMFAALTELYNKQNG